MKGRASDVVATFHTWNRIAFATLVGLGTTSIACATKVPEMAVPEHESQATALEAQSVEHLGEYDPDDRVRVDECVNVELEEICWTSLVNPTEEHFHQARAARDLARAHREAAQDLREAEAVACRKVSARNRDVSPFARVEDIGSVERVDTGAVVVFHEVPGLTEEKLANVLACHVARNAVVGTAAEQMPYCPLTVLGVELDVQTVEGGFQVNLSAPSERADEFNDRVNELSRRVTRGGPEPGPAK